MSADLAARLRALAHDHHAGRLDLAAYRKLRAPLLDSLELHARATDDMAVTQPRSLGRAAGTPSQAGSTAVESAVRVRTLPRIIVALFTLLLIAAGAWWALQRSTLDEEAAADPIVAASPVQKLVAAFVQRGDWSDTRVAALNVALLELGERQLGAVASEQWFQRFVDDLRKRFKEQQALVQTPLTAQSSPLAALAVTVGLDLNSPDAAIRITAIDPPAATPEPTESSLPTPATPVEATPRTAPASAPRVAAADAEASARQADAARAVAAKGSLTSPASAAAAAATRHPSTCRLDLIRSRRPFCHDTLPSGGNGPELALIPAGEFDMGSTAAAAEQPIHRVRIREPFALSVHEISQGEFRSYCEATGRTCAAQPWPGDDYPVVNVSWQDARGYVEWLSRATGFRYRLPSEAQWEYAARAGQSGLVPGGDTLSPTDAHYSMLTPLTAPAPRDRKFNDNAFRLLHTLGNVREWVEDAWVDGFTAAPDDGTAVRSSPSGMRVARGGSYADNAAKLRLSTREGLPAETRDALTGFRVLREVP